MIQRSILWPVMKKRDCRRSSISPSPESAADRQEIITDYRRAISQARRIDFLFSMSFMSQACFKQALFGQTVSSGRLTGSDHYGVINTYSYHMPC